jgi:hypothetical protein
MASTVQQTGGGSGVDLSELTSGELLFCSLLRTGYIEVITYSADGGHVDFGGDDGGVSRKSIDMSKISQISFETGTYTSTGFVVWKNESKETSTDFSRNTPFSISAPSGDNSHSMFTISTTNSSYVIIKVTSFTTKDGKVHTSSNLNY